ncbi:MAG: alpha/beta hydrolase [Brevundimonas sp.]|uniref:alpha/beta fold hydrolase n=1 Tax=Brevundimonas sp. TaxID=1871086 RepID=UPI0024885155|nr:alpha/beta hydrolase [Brevundimonas sp.]MDI1325799.1 alpha/beta hydrolase [Brevundimonas sp.]
MNRRTLITAAGLSPAALAMGAPAAATPPASGVEDALAAARFHTERRWLQTRFGDIAYTDRGEGPVALFLHGFPLNGFQWRGVIDRLEDVRRCIAPDSLGLGFTRVAEGQGVAPTDQVDMLLELMDRLDIQSFDLIANDSGGAVAQLLMLRRPERVRTVLLTNCDVEPDSPPPALLPVLEMAREGVFPDQWLAPWFADKALARSETGLGGQTYSRPRDLSDAAIETYLGPLVYSPARKAMVNAYAVALDSNPLAGIEAALGRLSIPVRIVWGMSDDIFSPADPDYLDRILPGSRGVRRVPAGKLFFPEEYPDVMAEEARRLWAG